MDRPLHRSDSSSVAGFATPASAAGSSPGSNAGDGHQHQRVNEPPAPPDGRFFVPAATNSNLLRHTKNQGSVPAAPAVDNRQEQLIRRVQREELTCAHLTNFEAAEIECATGAGNSPLWIPRNGHRPLPCQICAWHGGSIRPEAPRHLDYQCSLPGSSPAPLPAGQGAAMRAAYQERSHARLRRAIASCAPRGRQGQGGRP